MTEYQIAINEVQSGAFEPNVYRRACESTDGHASEIFANYVSLRVQDLLNQAEPTEKTPVAAQTGQPNVAAALGATLIRILGVVCIGAGFGMAASRYAVFGAVMSPLVASTLSIFGFSVYHGARALHPHLLHWLLRWPLVFLLWFSICFPIYALLDEWKRQDRVAVEQQHR